MRDELPETPHFRRGLKAVVLLRHRLRHLPPVALDIRIVRLQPGERRICSLGMKTLGARKRECSKRDYKGLRTAALVLSGTA
jgi:hypothetical protein